jgi:hypothetical protein
MKNLWFLLILVIIIAIAALPILFPTQVYFDALRMSGGNSL